MKFKIDVKAFIEMVMPVIEAAGSQPILRNAKDYLSIDGTLIKHCEGAIKSAISETLEFRNDKWNKKEVSKCCNDVSLAVRKKMFPLKRVTISAQYRKIEAIASEDSITARAALTRKDFEKAGYKCVQSGEFTVEPEYLRLILQQNVINWGIIEIAKTKNGTVKVKSEDKDCGIREFDVFSYHVNGRFPSKAKKIGAISKSVLIRAFKAIEITVKTATKGSIYKYVPIQFSEGNIQLFIGNGIFFSSYSISCEYLKCSKPIHLFLNAEEIESVKKSISALRGDEVTIKIQQDDEQDCIMFIQGKTHIAVRCSSNLETYPPVMELFNYGYKYSFKTKLYKWSRYIAKTINPVYNTYPLVCIRAHIEKGHFVVKHRENFRYHTSVEFIYGSDTKYYDLANINKKELVMVCLSEHIIRMCEIGSEKDVVCIEFGTDKPPTSESDRSKEIIPKMLRVKYPAKQFKKAGTSEQLVVMFPNNRKIPEAIPGHPTSGLEEVKTWFQ